MPKKYAIRDRSEQLKLKIVEADSPPPGSISELPKDLTGKYEEDFDYLYVDAGIVKVDQALKKAKLKKTKENQQETVYRTELINLENELLKRTCHFPRAAGHYKTTGGAASEDITINGLKASMKVLIQLTDEGALPVTIKTAKCGKNKLTITFSADPSTDHELDYFIFI